MTQHHHRIFYEDCFRCHLSRDEAQEYRSMLHAEMINRWLKAIALILIMAAGFGAMMLIWWWSG